ncbi:MAG: CehA/McbA family metallohydrolase [Candidatus Bathyarchaeia archaeon]
MKADLHVHTDWSDSRSSVKQVLEAASQKGLDGVAITDHNTMRGAQEALRAGRRLLIIPGEEVKTMQGEILALGITEPLPGGSDVEETIDGIHSQGGIAVAPHPTVPLLHTLPTSLLYALPLDAVEVFSAITPLAWRYARKNVMLARSLGLPMVAGSDSHHHATVGDAYTLIDAEAGSLDAVLKAVKAGRTMVGFSPSRLVYKLHILVEFLEPPTAVPRRIRNSILRLTLPSSKHGNLARKP